MFFEKLFDFYLTNWYNLREKTEKESTTMI